MATTWHTYLKRFQKEKKPLKYIQYIAIKTLLLGVKVSLHQNYDKEEGC